MLFRSRDDFAYATRDDLIPAVQHHEGSGPAGEHGLSGRYAEIEFDFVLQPTKVEVEEEASHRIRAAA